MNARILSLSGVTFEGAIRSLTVPTESGEITILPHHRSLVTILKKGKGRFIDAAGATHEFENAGGFLEVGENEAVLLLD